MVMHLADVALGINVCVITLLKLENGRLSTRICAFAQFISSEVSAGLWREAFV
jgi:hypothetical protein